jgi:hypothetical protein
MNKTRAYSRLSLLAPIIAAIAAMPLLRAHRRRVYCAVLVLTSVVAMVVVIPFTYDHKAPDPTIRQTHEISHAHSLDTTDLTSSYMAHRLAESDPQRLVDLYDADPEAMAFLTKATTHEWVTARRGKLVKARIPLIEYARLAAALDQTDPVLLFLAGATCTVSRYVEWRAAEERERHRILTWQKASTDTPPQVDDTDSLAVRTATWYRAAHDTGRPRIPSDGSFTGILDVDVAAGDATIGAYMRLSESANRTLADGADLSLGPLLDLAGGQTERLVSFSGVDANWADYTLYAAKNVDLLKKIEAGLVRNRGAERVLALMDEAASESAHATGICASSIVAASPYVPSLANLWTGPLYLFPQPLELEAWGRFESTPMIDAAALVGLRLS